MQIVINLSEEDYRHAFDYDDIIETRTLGRFRIPHFEEINVDALCRIIRDGKVLPEKHGRLIDGDYLYEKFVMNACPDSRVLQFVKEEPTVLEANKECDDANCD